MAGKPRVRTAYFNGGTGPVIVLAGGIYDSLIQTAGGTDAFPSTAVYVSKEEFAASNADVISSGPTTGRTSQHRRRSCRGTSRMSLPYATGGISEVPTAQTDSSISVMVGLTKIANALHPGLNLAVPTS